MAKQKQEQPYTKTEPTKADPPMPELFGIGVAQVRPGTSGWVAYLMSNRGQGHAEILTPKKRGIVGEDKFRALARAKTAFIEMFVTKGLTNKLRLR